MYCSGNSLYIPAHSFRMVFFLLKTMLVSLLPVCLGQDCGGFVEDAIKNVKVSYQSIAALEGEPITDVSKALVTWWPAQSLSDPSCYDLCINTDRISMPNAAALVMSELKRRIPMAVTNGSSLAMQTPSPGAVLPAIVMA